MGGSGKRAVHSADRDQLMARGVFLVGSGAGAGREYLSAALGDLERAAHLTAPLENRAVQRRIDPCAEVDVTRP